MRNTKKASARVKKKSGNSIITASGSARGVLSRLNPAARRTFVIVFLIVCALGLVTGIDAVLGFDKIHSGVSVAGVDVGGLRVEEASAAIEEGHGSVLSDSGVIVYGSDHTYRRALDGYTDAPDIWTVAPQTVGAVIDSSSLAQEAYSSTRGSSWLSGHLKALFGGIEVPLSIRFDEVALSSFIDVVDQTVGTPMIDASVGIEDGLASPMPEQTGYLTDEDVFRSTLEEAFLQKEATLVVPKHEVKPRIYLDEATAVADTVNAAIASPVTVGYEDVTAELDTAALSLCISTRIEEENGSFTLVPFSDAEQFKGVCRSALGDVTKSDAVDAYYDVSSGTPVLVESQIGNGPDMQTGATDLDGILFRGSPSRSITLETAIVEPDVSTEQAASYDIRELISTYTTEYTGGSARINNITVLGGILAYGYIEPGQTWSFHGAAGECTEERGFEAAGAIVDGELTDEIGGGICQVATTIFNAAFESGMPIVERRNHSRYMSSYPDGRDAAVSWPEPDLKFTNTTDAYMLLTVEATDSSVTVSLWGTSPGYTVEADTSDWIPGDSYSTKHVEDDTLPVGTEKVSQQGRDGHSVNVTRHVYKDGTEVSTDVFYSSYIAVPEVISIGTKTG